MIKLSKLTKATPVYRGVAGMRLPASFFKRNAEGIAGGVEYGFSSTTRKRDVAAFYAKVGEAQHSSTLLEAPMGMVNRGADIGFVSQVHTALYSPSCPWRLLGGLSSVEDSQTLPDPLCLLLTVRWPG